MRLALITVFGFLLAGMALCEVALEETRLQHDGQCKFTTNSICKKLQDFVCLKYGRSSPAQRCYERSFSNNYYLDDKRRDWSQKKDKILKGKAIECKYCCSNCDGGRYNRVEKGILVHQNNLVCLATHGMYYLPSKPLWDAKVGKIYWKPLSEYGKCGQSSNKVCVWDKDMSNMNQWYPMKWDEANHRPNSHARNYLKMCPNL